MLGYAQDLSKDFMEAATQNRTPRPNLFVLPISLVGDSISVRSKAGVQRVWRPGQVTRDAAL